MAPAERKTILLKLADLIDSHAAEIAHLDAIDAGKPIVDCEDIDVVDTVNTLRWYAEAVDKLFGRISPTGEDHLALITHEPVGRGGRSAAVELPGDDARLKGSDPRSQPATPSGASTW